MLFPNKLSSFQDSDLKKTIFILRVIEKQNKIKILSLYNKIKNDFDNIDEYINALDILFVLGKINLEEEDIVYDKKSDM